jgi:hypothetical protein
MQLCKELSPDDAYDEDTLVPLYALGDEIEYFFLKILHSQH